MPGLRHHMVRHRGHGEATRLVERLERIERFQRIERLLWRAQAAGLIVRRLRRVRRVLVHVLRRRERQRPGMPLWTMRRRVNGLRDDVPADGTRRVVRLLYWWARRASKLGTSTSSWLCGPNPMGVAVPGAG